MDREVDNHAILIKQLQEKTLILNTMLENKSFYSLSYGERKRRIKNIKRLYSQCLKRKVSIARIVPIAASIAALNITVPAFTQEPIFTKVQENMFGLRMQNGSVENSFYSLADIDADGDLDFLYWGYKSDDDMDIWNFVATNVGDKTTPLFALGEPLFSAFRYDSLSQEPPALFLATDYSDLDDDGDLDVAGFLYRYDDSSEMISIAYIVNEGNPHVLFIRAPRGQWIIMFDLPNSSRQFSASMCS